MRFTAFTAEVDERVLRNQALRIDAAKGTFHLSALKKKDQPDAVKAAKDLVQSRLRTVELVDVLIDIDNQTNFLRHFLHAQPSRPNLGSGEQWNRGRRRHAAVACCPEAKCSCNRYRPRSNRLASNTITVNPGFFRTELLTEESTNFAERTIEDYNERRAKQMEFWKGYNGQQSGDPAKLAQALITISSQEKPPLRFIAGADAVDTAEKVATTLQQQTEAYRELSSSLAYDKA